MVVDLQTDKVLYASNPDVVVPIASVTKLMTGMVEIGRASCRERVF